MLDAISDAPAWVRNARHDMLAANQLARALYLPLLAGTPHRLPNNARFVYLDEASKDFFTDWNWPPTTSQPCSASKPAATRTTRTSSH